MGWEVPAGSQAGADTAGDLQGSGCCASDNGISGLSRLEGTSGTPNPTPTKAESPGDDLKQDLQNQSLCTNKTFLFCSECPKIKEFSYYWSNSHYSDFR